MSRGGFVHNEVMLAPLAGAFEGQAFDTDFEMPVRIGDSVGFVDLVAEREGYCIAVEAECSARRVGRDLEKAEALGANELWIVVPSVRVEAAVRRALARMWVRVDCGGLFVLTQGLALKRVTNCLPLIAVA